MDWSLYYCWHHWAYQWYHWDYQWYHWYQRFDQWCIGYRERSGFSGQPMVPLAKFPMVPSGESWTHAIVSIELDQSVNYLPERTGEKYDREVWCSDGMGVISHPILLKILLCWYQTLTIIVIYAIISVPRSTLYVKKTMLFLKVWILKIRDHRLVTDRD